MSKYIDADRLKELLDAKYKEFTEKAKKDCPLQYQYMADGLEIAEQFIDSLQQEQPEVDLEEEYKTWWNFISGKINREHMMEWYMHQTARHFYELGLNARKKEDEK